MDGIRYGEGQSVSQLWMSGKELLDPRYVFDRWSNPRASSNRTEGEACGPCMIFRDDQYRACAHGHYHLMCRIYNSGRDPAPAIERRCPSFVEDRTHADQLAVGALSTASHDATAHCIPMPALRHPPSLLGRIACSGSHVLPGPPALRQHQRHRTILPSVRLCLCLHILCASSWLSRPFRMALCAIR